MIYVELMKSDVKYAIYGPGSREPGAGSRI